MRELIKDPKEAKPGYRYKTSEMIILTGLSREILSQKCHARGQKYAVRLTPRGQWLWDYFKWLDHINNRQTRTREEETYYDRDEFKTQKKRFA